MFGTSKVDSWAMRALDRSLAVIEFTPGGEILHANENFLKVIGYSANEIKGKHHRIFIDAEQVVTAEYQAGSLSGVIGVIGPTRMPYHKVVALVSHTSQLVSDLLS